MFCPDCGKPIDDEAMICPECGAVTKNGLLTLKEKESEKNSSRNSKIETTSNSEDNSKTLRLTAKVLGIAGSALLLSSLLGEYASVTAPLVGKVSVSMLNHLDKLIVLAFLLAGLGIVASFLKYPVLQIITGTVSVVWAGFMIIEAQNALPKSEYSALMSVDLGLGLYIFILAGWLILASGIVHAVAVKRAQVTVAKTKIYISKKFKITISACLGVLVLCGVAGEYITLNNQQGKEDAKTTVAEFMNAAIQYDVDSMNDHLAFDVDDKNGFMEVYTPETKSKAYLSNMGLSLSDLGEKEKVRINETCVLLGKNYLKNYEINGVTNNIDGTFTVKVSASILDLSISSEYIKEEIEELITAYKKENPSVIAYFYQQYQYSDEKVAKHMAIVLFNKICSRIDFIIERADPIKTEFTFVVRNIDGNYKITEINYIDK